MTYDSHAFVMIAHVADGLAVNSKSASAATPDWFSFWAFPIAFAITVAVLLCAICVTYPKHRKEWELPGEQVAQGEPKLEWPPCEWWFKERLHVGAKWTLKDSWASNVTVIAAAFAGVFGSSSALKAVLGTASNPIFALATVSSAVAVGLVGAAPLLLAIFRCNGDVTPAGLLAGATTTVAATSGELAVICLGISHLPLGGMQYVLPWAGLSGGSLVLGVYAFRTMIENLTVGLPLRTTKGTRPRHLPQLTVQANSLLADLHAELPDDRSPLDLIASAYREPMRTERRAGVF